MKLFSQRDIQWKDNLMGSGTLGNFGCTVTCLSMISEITPAVMNNEIKSVGGYQDNFIIWEKLDFIKGFDFIKRVRTYENAEVAANLPCLVEVNGAPIGGTTHWVLYIGNQKCYDPWDGKEKSTSTYIPIGYAVVKYKAVAEPCVIDDQTILPIIDANGNKMEVQAVRSKLADQDKQITNLLTHIDDLTFTVDALNAKISQLDQYIDDIPVYDIGASKTLQTINDICFGKGFIWTKLAKIKALFP
jgi:hypothetical protein